MIKRLLKIFGSISIDCTTEDCKFNKNKCCKLRKIEVKDSICVSHKYRTKDAIVTF